VTTVRIRKTPPHDVFAQPLGLSTSQPCWRGKQPRTPFDTLAANGIALLLADKSESITRGLPARRKEGENWSLHSVNDDFSPAFQHHMRVAQQPSDRLLKT
jgi:hypothetical protein